MFKNNKYTALYFSLISHRPQSTEYTEYHHVVPRSLGGSDSKDNIVKVSGRVHFILHRLLVKMVSDPEHIRKMNCALHFLSRRKEITNSRKFLIARAACVAAMAGRTLSERTKSLIQAKALSRGVGGTRAATIAAQKVNKGRKHSFESISNMSAAQKGKIFSKEHRLAIGRASKGRIKSQFAINSFRKRMKEHHHNKYVWILISPENLMFKVFEMSEFCEQKKLLYSSLRYKAQQQDIAPISRGPNTGWRVFGVSKNISKEEQIE